MGQKRTPQLVSKAKKLRADGRSFAEIAAELSKGGKPISKAAVVTWLKETTPAAAPPPPPPPPLRPALTSDELEEAGDLSPEEFQRALSAEFMRHQADAEAARAAGNLADARAASKLAGLFAGHLRQIHSKQDDDGDVIRVKMPDVQAAAERAVRGLQQLAERVSAERATWPKCEACGAPHGEFPPADKSPLRALVERIFGRLP